MMISTTKGGYQQYLVCQHGRLDSNYIWLHTEEVQKFDPETSITFALDQICVSQLERIDKMKKDLWSVESLYLILLSRQIRDIY